MHTTDEIAIFLREQTGYDGVVTEYTALQNDMGVDGDDMSDLLSACAEQFGVDMSGYLWYFHSGEEGRGGIGALFFKPPHERVHEIPISVRMLLDFANSGKWSFEYPVHSVPKYRIDVLINLVLLVLLGIGPLVLFLIKCTRQWVNIIRVRHNQRSERTRLRLRKASCFENVHGKLKVF